MAAFPSPRVLLGVKCWEDGGSGWTCGGMALVPPLLFEGVGDTFGWGGDYPTITRIPRMHVLPNHHLGG
jgi:hypothetical protein